jgi:hypothetical protein
MVHFRCAAKSGRRHFNARRDRREVRRTREICRNDCEQVNAALPFLSFGGGLMTAGRGLQATATWAFLHSRSRRAVPPP